VIPIHRYLVAWVCLCISCSFPFASCGRILRKMMKTYYRAEHRNILRSPINISNCEGSLNQSPETLRMPYRGDLKKCMWRGCRFKRGHCLVKNRACNGFTVFICALEDPELSVKDKETECGTIGGFTSPKAKPRKTCSILSTTRASLCSNISKQVRADQHQT